MIKEDPVQKENSTQVYLKEQRRAGEVIQQLGTPAALPEDPGSSVAPTQQLPTVCNLIKTDLIPTYTHKCR